MNAANALRFSRKAARGHEIRKKWPRAFVLVNDVLDVNFAAKADVRAALKRFRDERPFTLTDEAYLGAVSAVVRLLSAAYAIPEPAVWHSGPWEGSSATSEYVESQHTMLLAGKVSVIAMLHTFAHARGYGEHAAVWWSLNAFRITWPEAYKRLEKHLTSTGITRFMCSRCAPIQKLRHQADRAAASPPRSARGNVVRVMKNLVPTQTDPQLADNYDPFDATAVLGLRKMELDDACDVTPTRKPEQTDTRSTERAKHLELD